MKKLKPCPFCGSENIELNAPHPWAWEIRCMSCFATGPWILQSAEEAAKAWNTRPGINMDDLPDPDKLYTLASWFDHNFPDAKNPEVQSDLRRWADNIEKMKEEK